MTSKRLISILVNLLDELEQLMGRYDFPEATILSDFWQCSNRLQLYLIFILVNFSYELRQIITTYDFLELRWVILSYVRNDSQLDLILLLVNFWYELGKIMTRYVFLDARFVIWLASDLLLLLVNIWFWANNNRIYLLEVRNDFSNIQSNFNFIFGQFSVARKLILMAELSGRQASGLTVKIVPFRAFS